MSNGNSNVCFARWPTHLPRARALWVETLGVSHLCQTLCGKILQAYGFSLCGGDPGPSQLWQFKIPKFHSDPH